MKRALKYLALTISIFLLLIAVLLAFTQSAIFRELLRTKGLELSKPYFNGVLSIEAIDGNLYNTISLKNVALSEGDSLVAHFDRLHLKYHLKSLSDKHIIIDTLKIESPQFNLWYQDSASLHLLYVLDKLIPKNSSSPSKFPLILDVQHIAISNGRGCYQTRFTKPYIHFSDINILANGLFKEKHVDVNIKQVGFETKQPELTLKNSRLIFRKQGPQMIIDSLLLQSDYSQIKGKTRFTDLANFNVAITAQPLSHTDIKTLLPSLDLKTIPDLNLELNAIKDTLSGGIQLSSSNKQIALKAVIDEFSTIFSSDEKASKYKANIILKNFIPEDWLVIMKTGVLLNGVIDISGDNIYNYKDDFSLSAKLNHSSYKATKVDTLRIKAVQTANTITSDLRLTYNNSQSEGHIQVHDLFEKPVYEANVRTHNLDIEAIDPRASNTILSGEVNVSGRYIRSKKREFTATTQLYNSTIYNYNIDSLTLHSDYKDELLNIDNLRVSTQNTTAHCEGNYNFTNKALIAKTILRSADPSLLITLGAPDLNYANAKLKGQVNGTLDALNYSGDLVLTQAEYKGFLSSKTHALMNGFYSKDSLTSNGNIKVTGASAGKERIDTLDLNYTFHNSHFEGELKVKDDLLTANLTAILALNDTIAIRLSQGRFASHGVDYYLTDTTQQLRLADKTAIIDHIEIKDKKNTNFQFKANGIISSEQAERFDLLIRHFNLSRINPFITAEDSIGGLLHTSLALNGMPNSLQLQCKYTIEKPKYGDVKLPDTNGELSYNNNLLSLKTWLPQLDSAIHAQVTVPFSFNLNAENELSYHLSDTFNAQLYIDSLNINTPDIPEYEHIKSGANVSGQVNATGTFSHPIFKGAINFDDGYMSNHKRGVYYKNAHGRILFKDNTIKFDTVYIQSDKGYYASKGHLTFDTSIVTGRVINSEFVSDINKFHIAQHKNYDINISGNPRISSQNGSPLFGGTLTINNSSFYIPGLLNYDDTNTAAENTPLLVAALQKNDTLEYTAEVQGESVKSPLLNQLHGRLTVDIPRSTWLKSNDMNIEIGGDFDVAKTGDYFELFGDVEIIRGHYILYGRKFTISEGLINFMGGEKPDPRLEIKASYIFRSSDKEKRTLELSITEYLSEPVINFTLDDDAISQSDAVSIMVFGKTMDELNYDGQNGIIGSVGSNMLANMVTSSLNSTIGQRFKLDMIEVNSTENWQSAAFVVGKYITNDLFVIYQKGFGETEDDEITPETITLEYELNKILFFRLQSGSSKTSGFDVILKFESKK